MITSRLAAISCYVATVSLAFVNEPAGFATEYCATTPASPPLLNIESGNIQVR